MTDTYQYLSLCYSSHWCISPMWTGVSGGLSRSVLGPSPSIGTEGLLLSNHLEHRTIQSCFNHNTAECASSTKQFFHRVQYLDDKCSQCLQGCHDKIHNLRNIHVEEILYPCLLAKNSVTVCMLLKAWPNASSELVIYLILTDIGDIQNRPY